MSINKISFSSIAIIQIVSVILLYYFWINELIHVLSQPMSINFRDPKESFSFTLILFVGIIYSTLVIAILHFLNGIKRNKTNMNRWLKLISILCTLIIFGNFIYNIYSGYRNYNPFSAIMWLRD